MRVRFFCSSSILFSLIFFATVALHSAHPKEPNHFESRNVEPKNLELEILYNSGKYDEALLTLKSHPKENDPDFYYNLGTVHYKKGDFGAAVSYLEKANRLRPRSPEIQANLELARASLIKKIGPDLADPSSSLLQQWFDPIPPREIQIALAVLLNLGLLSLIQAYRSQDGSRRLKKILLSPFGWAGVVCLFLVLTLYGAEKWSRSQPPAMSLKQQAVRSGPGDRYFELYQVEAGTKLRALGLVREGWVQVRYSVSSSGDGIGWVPASQLLVL